MIKVFKTNVNDLNLVQEIKNSIKTKLGIQQVTFDLEDIDCILRVEGLRFSPLDIIQHVNHHGCSCEELL